jgi:predicted Zn-ribbon and HTH transcriptional regulator
MLGKLIKKFKKINIYFRVGIVYGIFLIIKWFMYEIVGIEIGKEGFSPASLVARINGGATELAKLCTNQQVKNSSSSNNEQKLKLQLKQCNAEKFGLIKRSDCPKKPSTCPKCDDCSKYAAVLKKVSGSSL